MIKHNFYFYAKLMTLLKFSLPKFLISYMQRLESMLKSPSNQIYS